jgi:hypothetical protein
MALVNGLYKLTDQEFHDRPVYQNVGNGHSFLSWYYDATQMTEGDGYWKISAENMLDKMGGHIFLSSTAQSPSEFKMYFSYSYHYEQFISSFILGLTEWLIMFFRNIHFNKC